MKRLGDRFYPDLGFTLGVGFLIAVLIILPYAGIAYNRLVQTDAGVYIYAGRVILDGGMPYVDVWSHKGPLLYLFNAAGLLLGEVAGVYLLEGVAIAVGLYVSALIWRQLAGGAIAVMAVIILSGSYYIFFQGGNLTETWALPFLLVTYSLGACYFLGDGERARLLDILAIMIGVTLAVTLLSRVNNGLGVAVLGLILMVSSGSHRRVFVLSLAAFTAICLPVMLWVYRGGAFAEFIDQYIYYSLFHYIGGKNYSYGDYHNVGILKSIKFFLQALILSPLPYFMVLMIYHSYKIPYEGDDKKHILKPIIFFAVIFVVDFLSILISRRSYLHYGVIILPSLIVIGVIIGTLINKDRLNKSYIDKNILVIGFQWTIMVFLLFIGFSEVLGIADRALLLQPIAGRGFLLQQEAREEISSFIMMNSDSDDRFLIHGHEGGALFLALTDRRSPTPFVYFDPVLRRVSNYYERYLDDIFVSPPDYIIETPDSCGISSPCPLGAADFIPLRQLVAESYRLDVEMHDYKIWRRREDIEDEGGAR